MNQGSLLQHVFDAKKAHLRWVKRARHLVEGLPVDKEFVPLKPTDCHFGTWLYSEGAILNQISSTSKLMQQIELIHNEVHDTYKNIYEIFFIIPNEKSLLYKIFTFNSYKISTTEQEKAKIYLKYLQRASQELIILLTELGKEITTFSYRETTPPQIH